MSQVCIDSMKLAHRYFIRCRAFGKECPPFFDFFEYAMSEVLRQGVLIIFVEEEAIFQTEEEEWEAYRTTSKPSPPLTPEMWRGIELCRTSACALKILHRNGNSIAIQAIGNALHNIPYAIAENEPDNFVKGFAEYLLTEATLFWNELDQELHAALAHSAGFTVPEAEKYIEENKGTCGPYSGQ